LAPEDEDFISEMFAKYDQNDTGALEESEIAKLMADLNDGHPVPQATVKQYVAKYDINQNGKIEKKEVRKLVAAWYINVEDQKNSAGCCIVS